MKNTIIEELVQRRMLLGHEDKQTPVIWSHEEQEGSTLH